MTNTTENHIGTNPWETHRLLRRSGEDRMVAGVAGGLARYFDVDASIVRIAFVVATLLGGAAVPLYLAAWLLIPEDGCDVSVASELLGRGRL